MEECSCCAAPKLIFPCSGASDVGEVTDRAARRLTKSGFGKMYCLAGVGGRVEDMLSNVTAAAAILAIDGCKANCARRTLELAGFKDFKHIRLNDMGMEKGESPANYDNITKVVEKATAMLVTE
jgi:uncharacterized metal-binding protein